MKYWIFALLIGVAFTAPENYHHIHDRSVGTLLDQLVQETGLHELLPWVQDKIRNDPDAKRIIEFFKSDQWDNIKDHLKACPEYLAVKDELLNEDINLVQILDDIKTFVIGTNARTLQPRSGLSNILDDFIGQLDLESLVAVIREKIKTDKDMIKLVGFVKGQKLKDIVACMKESTDVQDLLEELLDEGIDVKKLIEMVKALFPATRYLRQTRNVQTLLDKLIEETGVKDLLPWVQDKIKNDPDAGRVIEFFKGEQWVNIKNHLKGCPDYPAVQADMLKEGVDIIKVLDDIKNFVVGSSRRQTRATLGDILNDFIGQLDLESIVAILSDKVKSDPDMKKIVDFVEGEQLKNIEACMDESPDVQDLLEELIDEGIDVKKLIEMVKALFPTARYLRHQETRIGLDSLQELISKLVEFLKNLFPGSSSLRHQDARINLDSLQQLISKLFEFLKNLFPGSSSLRQLDARINLDSIQVLINKLLEFLKNLFPSSGSVRQQETRISLDSLQALFKKLIELLKNLFPQSGYLSHLETRIGLDSIQDLVNKLLDFLKNLFPGSSSLRHQEERINLDSLQQLISKLVEFLKNLFPGSSSLRHQDARINLDSLQQLVSKLVEFLKNLFSGSNSLRHDSRINLDSIQVLINKLLDFLKNLFPSSGSRHQDVRISLDSLQALFKKLIELLKNLFPSSGYLRHLETRIGLDSIQVLINKLLDFLKNLFPGSGYYHHKETRSVHNLLQELIKESGLHDLLPWFQDKIRNDPDLQRFVDYFRGERWATLKQDVENCPNYQSIKDKLMGEGIDIIQILEEVRKFFTGDKRSAARASLNDLLNDILGQLDLDNIIFLIYDKLEGDEDMQKLVDFVKGDDIKEIAECLRGSAEVQNLLEELRDEGIDVVRIVEMLKLLFASDYYLSLPVSR